MYTQKKNYILQLKVSRFHDHQAALQSKDQSYLLYCEIGGTQRRMSVHLITMAVYQRIFAGD